MAERIWTIEQKQCIEARGGTVLVSAAAGSGKTSVLVQRVVERIADRDNPLDVDRLLVVTFTKAAAAEMKQRLSAALAERIAENPTDMHLQRQQMLVPRANISTVHGFCANLLREHFHLLDISPQFRIAEEGEISLLREEALSEVMEECYAEESPIFMELASLLGSGRDDRGIWQAVRRIDGFIQSHPFPEDWLEDKIKAFDEETPIASSPWGLIIKEYAAGTVQYAVSLLRKARMVAAEEPKMDAAYGAVLDSDYRLLSSGLEQLPALSWDECAPLLCSLGAFGRLGALRKYEDEARKERVKCLREEARKKLKALPVLLCGSEAECRNDLAAMRGLVETLFSIVVRYEKRMEEKKKKRRVLDFNDLEHGALRLLITRTENGAIERTPLAKELSSQFDEVLVDEYQDTNAAQDALFSALSRNETNLFMVGDVKQSIYGFRQAMPAIFINRRDSYPPYDGFHFPAAITLGNNFRSRAEVTDSVNFLFRQLMTREAGGIDYDEREALVPSASYPENAGAQTELLLYDSDLTEEGEDKDTAEARGIAVRIRELMQSFSVTEKGVPRPARYGDFCLLLRSKTSHAQAYVDELNRCGIPAWTASTGGFFSAPEVSMVLALLRFIDNPLQDVPLLAVMLSPVFGFTPDDMASIRLLEGHAPFYTAVRRMCKAEYEADPTLPIRCEAFLRQIDHYRLLATTMPADRLLHRIYEDGGLLPIMAVRPHGQQRTANLRLLHDYARRFEQNGFRGLSAFVRYIDRLEQQKMDMAPASLVSEHADVVRIISIHHSKGLEFPIVFLAGLGNQFNPDSTRGDMLLHADLGIGLVRRETDTLKQYRTVPWQGVALAIQKSERTEELRVLYVAMTRAKEKLVLAISTKNPAARLSRLASTIGDGETLSPFHVLSARCMGDWILSAALRHPSGGQLRQLADFEELSIQPCAFAWDIRFERPPSVTKEETAVAQAIPADNALYRLIQERLRYRYPYAPLSRIPSKLAASELSHGEIRQDFVATGRPAFLSSVGLTPAERGTALHTFMQFADYTAAERELPEEIGRLVSSRFLSQPQGDSLPLAKIRAFLRSGIYRRMKASPRLQREYHFTVDIPASIFEQGLPGESGTEKVLIQGIADCVFEELGGLVVVDYKTDRVKTPEELVHRYQGQLRIYAMALERTWGLPVRQCLLYSFALSVEIPVELQALDDIR